MKIYLTLLLFFTSMSGFDSINRNHIDSIKPLVASAVKSHGRQDTLTINRLNKLARYYFESNPDSTIYYGNISIAQSRKINYKAGLASGLLQAGHANYFKGNFELAKKELDEAISIFKNLKDLKGLSNTYKVYGKMYTLLADYKTALIFLNLALDIDKQQNNKPGAADCYKNIGMLNFSRGQSSSALDYYYKALFIDVEQHNKHATADIYINIGDVLHNMESYQKALECYKKALGISQESKDTWGIGTADEDIGEALLAEEKYDEAISYLLKSLKISKKIGDNDMMSYVFGDLGRCYANKSEMAIAFTNLDSALAISSKYKIVYNQTYALISYAVVYNIQKDYTNAYKFGIRGQELATKLGNLWFRTNAALELNKSLTGIGDFKEANKMLWKYIKLKDSLKNNDGIQKQTSYNLSLNFAAKQQQYELSKQKKEILYQQQIKEQRLTFTFAFIIVVMTIISLFYYRQKIRHQKTISMLGDKNTEILQQKANLKEAAQKLNNLNTLKDRLIGILAHDLRTPLNTLRGVFDLFQDKTLTMDEMLAMIPNIIKKLDYTSDFLDTLLFWINSQVENFEIIAKNFCLKEVAACEIANHDEQAASKGITIIDSVPADLIASSDPDSVRIVIRNLITNAIKFSKQDDIIEVSARLHQDFYYNQEYCVITVRDTGIGMCDDQVSKLFNGKVNSGTGTNNESGTGMGMMFCRDLVERCGGKIWATSRKGGGSEFSFTLPVSSVLTVTKELQLAC